MYLHTYRYMQLYVATCNSSKADRTNQLHSSILTHYFIEPHSPILVFTAHARHVHAHFSACIYYLIDYHSTHPLSQ